ncbi:MAG TPA: YncE family protein [Verrucomicrobiae bacterium]|nr:YncE family protein [Verrucomicrobiae bacterium]
MKTALRSGALALAVATIAAAPAPLARHRATGTIAASAIAYFPGSALQIGVDGFPGPYGFAVIGQGTVAGGLYRLPLQADPGGATLLAASAAGLAAAQLRIAAAPGPDRTLIAVASYDDGVAVHDAGSFRALGILGTAGSPSDVAFTPGGRLAATDTQGDAITVATLRPWSVARVAGVPLGDEIAVDPETNAIFVTDRGGGDAGELTRIAADGAVAHVATGATAEGLAIDARHGIVYVANVNDDTVAAVDAATMRLRERFKAVARVFALALSTDGSLLYAVSNQSASSPFGAPGRVVAIALRGKPRVVARSADLAFPVGIALDASLHRLFVTDEERDRIDVLDARTLRSVHAPLPTCRTPWKPSFDPVGDRLYVPCARADRVDVYDARTLARVRGAPFATGGYPLAVAVWHPAARAKHPSS